jgi:hypothetical protein
MHLQIFTFVVALAFFHTVGAFAQTGSFTDDQIRKEMIRQSIAAYPGNCPCPYNFAKNGSRCGGRSAHSRPGGYAPLCFASDISDAMILDYRKRNAMPHP